MKSGNIKLCKGLICEILRDQQEKQNKNSHRDAQRRHRGTQRK